MALPQSWKSAISAVTKNAPLLASRCTPKKVVSEDSTQSTAVHAQPHTK